VAKASKQLIQTPGIDVQFLVDAEDSGGSTTAFIARKRAVPLLVGGALPTSPRRRCSE
jgi:hypothetical protein